MSRKRLEVSVGDIIELKDNRIKQRDWEVIKYDNSTLIALIENINTKDRKYYGAAILNDLFTIKKVA